MNIKGTKHVWAVRTSHEVLIFATKPTLIRGIYGSWWSDGKSFTYCGELFSFCPREFNKIATLPLNKPVKLTIKVTLK